MRAIADPVGDARPRPRLACIEWIEPLMPTANWMPELVEMAGSAPDNPEPGARHMKRLPAEPSDVAGLSFAADQLAMNVHGDVDSHVDALCHVSYDEFRSEEHTSELQSLRHLV